MTRQKRGEQTAGDIVQAATGLFALHGYYHTSTSDILEAASVSKGSFYYHFKSKRALALAVLEQVEGEYEEHLIGPVLALTDGEGRLRIVFERIRELNESGQWLNTLLLARLAQDLTHRESPLNSRLTEILQRLLGFWQELFRDARTAGIMPGSSDPAATAQLVMSALFGAVIFHETEGDIVPFERVLRHLERLVRGGES